MHVCHQFLSWKVTPTRSTATPVASSREPCTDDVCPSICLLTLKRRAWPAVTVDFRSVTVSSSLLASSTLTYAPVLSFVPLFLAWHGYVNMRPVYRGAVSKPGNTLAGPAYRYRLHPRSFRVYFGFIARCEMDGHDTHTRRSWYMDSQMDRPLEHLASTPGRRHVVWVRFRAPNVRAAMQPCLR